MSKIALWSILIGGTGIRVLFLFQPIALDEATTYVYYASQPLPLALSDYSAPNNHLFHTLLVHLVTRFGSEEWIIRLPAFLAGIAIIPATYAVGKRLYSENAGLLAAVLVAASSALIEYSTNARGYTLVTLFTLLLILTATSLLERESRRLWGLFVILSALGFYTIPTMLYPFVSIAVWLGLIFVARRKKQQLFSLLSAGSATAALTLLLYLPVFVRSGAEAVIGNVFVQPLAWQDFTRALSDALARTWQLWNQDFPFFLQMILLGGVVIALLAHRRTSQFPIPLFAVALLVSALLVLVGQVAPFARVWLWLLPLYLLTASAGMIWVIRCLRLASAFIPVMAVLLCAGICANVAIVRGEKPFGDVAIEPDAENVVLFLREHIPPEADYTVVPVSAPLVYYFIQHGLPLSYLGGDLSQVNTEHLIVVVLEPDYTLETLLNLMQQYGLNVEPYSHRIRLAQFDTASLWELTR